MPHPGRPEPAAPTTSSCDLIMDLKFRLLNTAGLVLSDVTGVSR